MLSHYTLGWLGMGLWFAIEEFLALRYHRGQGMTLSEHVWAWFSVNHEGRFWRLRRILLIAGMSVLSIHFIFGGNII